MQICGLIDEDLVNYKKPCMTIMFPYCTFKCNKECGREVCHNIHLKDADIVDISVNEIVDRYINNPISEALVMQGLEPFDSFEDLYDLVYAFTAKSDDDIVIYTGYTEQEIVDKVQGLVMIIGSNHLIIKYGRFIPDKPSLLDPILGVKLSSDNQYAKQIL